MHICIVTVTRSINLNESIYDDRDDDDDVKCTLEFYTPAQTRDEEKNAPTHDGIINFDIFILFEFKFKDHYYVTTQIIQSA